MPRWIGSHLPPQAQGSKRPRVFLLFWKNQDLFLKPDQHPGNVLHPLRRIFNTVIYIEGFFLFLDYILGLIHPLLRRLTTSPSRATPLSVIRCSLGRWICDFLVVDVWRILVATIIEEPLGPVPHLYIIVDSRISLD